MTSELIVDDLKNNIFKLQMQETLKHLRINYEKTEEIKGFLKKMKDWIMVADNIEDSSLAFPAVFPPEDHLEFSYEKPLAMHLVGSFLLKTSSKIKKDIDIAIEFPKGYFKDKDYLNYRYFKKRYFYLKCIEKIWKEKQTEEKFTLEYVADEEFKGHLLMKKDSYLIKIFMCMDISVFPFTRLNPDRNCIRAKLYGEDKEVTEVSTPTYNQHVLMEMLYKFHLQYLHPIFLENKEIIDALILLKTWANQRGLMNEQSLSGFILSMIVGHLYTAGTINPKMDSYHVILLTFEYLKNLNVDGTNCMHRIEENDKITQEFNELSFNRNYNAVLVDPSGLMNLFFKMSRGTLQQIKSEADRAFEMLKKADESSFSNLFLKKMNPIIQFDTVFVLSFTSVHDRLSYKFKELNQLDYAVNCIEKLATKSFRDRIVYVRCWRLNNKIYIGIMKNGSNCDKPVELGPLAENQIEAEEFRNFWGEICELRRFADGSIREAIIWKPEPNQTIFQLIMSYTLNRHFTGVFNLKSSSEELHEREVEQDESRLKFNELSKILTSIKTLPLSINTVFGVSPSLRMTHLKNETYHEGCIEFEISGHWPEDITAMQWMKIAFLEELGKALRETHGLHYEISGLGFIEIHFKENVFRLFIHLQREIENIKKLNLDFGNVVENFYVKRKKVADMTLQVYNKYPTVFRQSVKLIKKWIKNHFCMEMQPFCVSYPKAFSTICSSALNGYFNHFSNWSIFEDRIDLLVVKIFSDSLPFDVPASPFVALLRFFDLISTSEGYIFIPSLVEPDVRAFNDFIDSFNSTSCAFRIGTEFDINCVDYSIGVNRQKMKSSLCVNDEVIARLNYLPRFMDTEEQKIRWKRMIKLAQSSAAFVENCYQQDNASVDVKTIFNSPLDDFDVILYLNVESGTANHIHPSERKVMEFPKSKQRFSQSDVERFVQDLEREMGEFSMIFHRDDVVGIVWKRYAIPCKDSDFLNLEKRKFESFKNDDAAKKKQLKSSAAYPVNVIGMIEESTASFPFVVEPNFGIVLHQAISLGGNLIKSMLTK